MRETRFNPVTLKLEGDLDILKMYPRAENEAASSRHSELRVWVEKIRNIYVSRSKVKVKCH